MTTLVEGALNKSCIWRWETLRIIELKAIDERLTAFRGNPVSCAKSLGISKATLYRKIKELKEEKAKWHQENKL